MDQIDNFINVLDDMQHQITTIKQYLINLKKEYAKETDSRNETIGAICKNNAELGIILTELTNENKALKAERKLFAIN